MPIHLHPETQIPIAGMILRPGATLQENDWYASTDGKWQLCPIPGLILQAGCNVMWVRPCVELSLEAKSLLAELAPYNFCLTHHIHWKMIPSPAWKYDGRMDWELLHPECVQELLDYGFLELHPEDPSVYQLSEAGRTVGKELLN